MSVNLDLSVEKIRQAVEEYVFDALEPVCEREKNLLSQLINEFDLMWNIYNANREDIDNMYWENHKKEFDYEKD